MKKIFSVVFAVLFVLIGCTSCDKVMTEELAEVYNQIDFLKSQVLSINESINSLDILMKEVKNGGYIISCEPFFDQNTSGYIIILSNGNQIVIRNGNDGIDGSDGHDGIDGSDGHDGRDGFSPTISVKQDSDNIWYWTLNGQWLLDENGKKVSAMGVTPQMKIESGNWFVSVDGGFTWAMAGRAQGESGDTLFKEVTIKDGVVSFVLADGSSFDLPIRGDFNISLNIDEDRFKIGCGETLPIYYTISCAEGGVTVTASSDGHFKTRVEDYGNNTGVIFVSCPDNYSDGYITIIACDRSGRTVVKVINFEERSFRVYSSLSYSVGPFGGEIDVDFSSNFDFSVGFEDDSENWIVAENVSFNSGSGTIHLSVEKNNLESARTGVVDIIPANNPGCPYVKIIIEQSSSYFSIDQSGFTVPSSGDEISVHMSSSRGLYAVIPEEYSSWISGSWEEDGYNFIWNLRIQRNQTNDERGAEIPIYTSDGVTLQGKIVLRQLSPGMDSQKNMVIRVSANSVNQYKVYLPIVGELKCYVDWGDGTMDHIERTINPDEPGANDYVCHQYTKELKYYDVSIAGKVQRLNSKNISQVNGCTNAIREILQWGDLGFSSLRNAFLRCSALNKVANDDLGAFRNVKDFSLMFSECASLETVPENLFAEAIEAELFEGLFSNCMNLRNVPENLFSNCPKVKTFSSAFCNCTLLSHIPESLFFNNPEVENFNGCFSGSGLESISADVFSHNPQVYDFSGTFRGCNKLKLVPESIFNNNFKVLYFYQTFYYSGIDNKAYGLETPYTVIKGIKYHLYERYKAPDYFVIPVSSPDCFTNFHSVDEDKIPSAWKSW